MEEVKFELFVGDSKEKLKDFSDNHFDSVVCDGPYGIRFMGKAWDSFDIEKGYNKREESAVKEDIRPGRKSNGFGKSLFAGQYNQSNQSNQLFQQWTTEISIEVFRVLKPGGYFLSFCSPRTFHRLVSGIEDAGFEIRDTIMWVFSSGFPKSHNVGKAMDKESGVKSEVIGIRQHPTLKDKSKVDRQKSTQFHGTNPIRDEWDLTSPTTDDAKKWVGWGSALKPAYEPICMARKPLEKGLTIAENVRKWGTGAIDIDDCRIEGDPWTYGSQTDIRGGNYKDGNGKSIATSVIGGQDGRWPANLIHDGSEEVVALFPDSKGQMGDIKGTEKSHTGGEGTNCYGEYNRVASAKRNDSGSAARFFYVPKTSRADRNEGCESLPLVTGGMVSNTSGQHITRREDDYVPVPVHNNHPTVKPTELMRYLVRMVTPKGGLVLDHFCGSGSTGKACMIEGMRFVGIDQDQHNIDISRCRIQYILDNQDMFGIYKPRKK